MNESIPYWDVEAIEFYDIRENDDGSIVLLKDGEEMERLEEDEYDESDFIPVLPDAVENPSGFIEAFLSSVIESGGISLSLREEISLEYATKNVEINNE